MHRELRINDRVIEEWKQDIATIKSKEVVRIVSGEAFCDLYRALKNDIKNAAVEYDVEFKMITGPIISVEEETDSNAVFELSDEGFLDLWISPYRQLNHFRVFDNRFVYYEDYHEALSEDRSGKRSIDLVTVSKYNYDFDNLITALSMPKYSEDDCFIKATKIELFQVKENYGKLYDFISADDFRKKTEELHLGYPK